MLLTKFHFEICRANILCFTKTEFSLHFLAVEEKRMLRKLS